MPLIFLAVSAFLLHMVLTRLIATQREQIAAHGLAWIATYGAALREMLAWGERLEADGRFGEREGLILQLAFGEYLAQLRGGLPMSQGESVRPADLGLDATALDTAPMRALVALNTAAARRRLGELVAGGDFGQAALDDETLAMIREQFRKFADEHAEAAHGWHRRDELIPLGVVEELAALGVFGLTIPEDFGGAGLGKTAMCVVTEELSRGYIGLGSLGTRSEIAAELIRLGGTEEQRAHWLPKLASGEILPTAVFTEPNTGSDLGALRTRAAREGGTYRVTGNKTWITHAARADVMTLLVRTDPATTDYRGLSMLLAPKPRAEQGQIQSGIRAFSHWTNIKLAVADQVHTARRAADGIVINAAAYSHTSVAILDALNACDCPVIEVHISNVHKREAFRHHSHVSARAEAVIAGCGTEGYLFALRRLARLLT